MFKRIATLLVILITLFLVASSATAQNNGRAGADSHFSTLWPTILQRQLLYHATHGRFFQGLITHGSIPDGVLDEPIDRGTWHPSDQRETWLDFFGDDVPPTGLPYAISFDVYDAPNGSGFVAHLYVREGADIYTRSVDVGPEGRGEAWDIIVLQ